MSSYANYLMLVLAYLNPWTVSFSVGKQNADSLLIQLCHIAM